MHGGEGVEQRPSSPDTDNSVITETPSPPETQPRKKLKAVILCPVTVAIRELETLLEQSGLDDTDHRIPIAARFQEQFQEHHWPSLWTEEGVQWTWFPGLLPQPIPEPPKQVE